jgi:ABC-2 type transport system permease protein
VIDRYLALTKAELRLFRREPFSIVFVLAFPLMMMLLLSAVFGNDQEDATAVENGMLVWKGVTPDVYYTSASVAAIVGALGFITLPSRLTAYREQGILRRFRASSVSSEAIIASQLTLAAIMFVAGTVLMAVIARVTSGAALPEDVLGVVVALVLGTTAFGAIGVLLAIVLKTSRSAQGIGLLLFLGSWLISGTAPPPAVLPSGLRDFGGAMPMGQLVDAIQEPWFGQGWDADSLIVLAGITVVVGAPAMWLFDRE